jgi:hypothetical protein
MKQMNAFKLTVLAGSVAALGMGCASSGYARYDADNSNNGMGVSASAQTGTDSSLRASSHVSEAAEGSARSTVSALSFGPETRADWVNRFPFYDISRQMRTIETYTFAVPDDKVQASIETSNLPQFSADLPPGSVFVESAGGAGEVRTGRVIQHSPNPR